MIDWIPVVAAVTVVGCGIALIVSCGRDADAEAERVERYRKS